MSKTISPTQNPAQPPIDKYKMFLNWRTRPLTETKIADVEDFCLKYNTTKVDLVEFQQRASYTEDLERETINWLRKQTPEILHILVHKIKTEKSAADIQKFSEIYKIMTHKDNEKSNTNTYNFISLDPEKFKTIAIREAQFIKEGMKEIK